mgnify:CR=1 FL=1
MLRPASVAKRKEKKRVKCGSSQTALEQWAHTCAPLQLSFCRKVLKKDVPAECRRRVDRSLRRITTDSPAAIGATTSPSADSSVSIRPLKARMPMVECKLTTTERFDKVCGQIGVSVNTPALGLTIAPPAARE